MISQFELFTIDINIELCFKSQVPTALMHSALVLIVECQYNSGETNLLSIPVKIVEANEFFEKCTMWTINRMFDGGNG